jgi:acetyl esterase/lipase
VQATALRTPRRRGRTVAATLIAVLLVVGNLVVVLSGIAHAQTVRYRDHVFTNVTVNHDVTFDGTDKLDVYAPSGDTHTARAAVAWFHPGGFTEGDKANEADLANDLARRGYVVFVVDYTLNPTLQWFDMNGRIAAARVADLEAHAAIGWIKHNAKHYGVDPSLVFAGGYSAGAIIAFDLDYGPAPASERVAGAFAIAGYSNESAQPGAAPMLDFHGTNDALIPRALAQTTCASAEHVGDSCTVDTYTGMGHEIGYTQRAAILERASAFLSSLIASS